MKTIAIHQSDFLPYLGFWWKMAHCDIFVILDDAPFSKGSVTNRNRIKTQNGVQWLTVPILTKGKLGQPIYRVEINNEVNWGEQHQKTIEQSYGKAPFWDDYKDDLTGIYEDEYLRLQDFNLELIDWMRFSFGIKCGYAMSSHLCPYKWDKTQRLIDICKSLDADAYVSGTGGKDYLDESLFEQVGIKVIWSEFKHPIYPQLHGDFMPLLSGIDLLLNCGKESLRKING